MMWTGSVLRVCPPSISELSRLELRLFFFLTWATTKKHNPTSTIRGPMICSERKPQIWGSVSPVSVSFSGSGAQSEPHPGTQMPRMLMSMPLVRNRNPKMRHWANWRLSPQKKDWSGSCWPRRCPSRRRRRARDRARITAPSPITAHEGPAIFSTMLQCERGLCWHAWYPKMESRTPTHSRTAPKTKRKKMSLLTCLSLWSPSGSAVPTEDMTGKEQAFWLFLAWRGNESPSLQQFRVLQAENKCRITVGAGISAQLWSLAGWSRSHRRVTRQEAELEATGLLWNNDLASESGEVASRDSQMCNFMNISKKRKFNYHASEIRKPF